MLKKELAKLLETLKDDDNIDETISKSDLGKALVNSGLTLDTFKEKIESDPNFKSFIDSEKDKHLQKGIDTFKTNNLQKLVDEEYKKQHPEADPKDTEIAKLKKQFEDMQKESLKKDLTNKALKIMTEKKLPADLVSFIVGADEDTTNKNLETLEKVFNSHDEAIKTEILKDGTYKPGGQGGAKPTEDSVKGQINSIFGIKE
ncbi:MAG: DUF4355 domain-containing protein [Clostridium sp.]|jgi:signal-transduction protein with cAMP-binding, CBS, and nucleotidyltransferase domain|uniref:DUF4355 domain-containing protein n=1 Tax=Clostridium sp. TaxID=1506 RepID=UPI0025B8896A|nr:DUF4355 domain-containing protein [Clostridium sp.]MCH3962684.1 DUF4355 domain-containing protein [Clostridium sp.]MCI2201069.1 DUF4355 domain-containing protein [Clostridium sp.]